MERKTVELWDLLVPTKMLRTKPKLYKIMGMKAYYKKYGHFYGEIIVDTNYKILDGYVLYCTAKEMRQYNVPIKIVTKKDRVTYFFRRILKKIKGGK